MIKRETFSLEFAVLLVGRKLTTSGDRKQLQVSCRPGGQVFFAVRGCRIRFAPLGIALLC